MTRVTAAIESAQPMITTTSIATCLMGQVIGVSNTNGFGSFSPSRSTIWSIDNHEVVHLYLSTFGSPVVFTRASPSLTR